MKKMKSLSEIPFLKIIKDSWKITWKNRFLWWLGFFISLTSLNFSQGGDWKEETNFQDFGYFWERNWETILIIAGLLLLLFLFFIFLSFVARGGLIQAIEKISRGEKTNFKTSFKEGKKNFKGIFVINILLFLSIIIIIAVVSLPAIYCFLNQKIVTGVLIAVPGFLIFLASIILASFLKIFSQIYLVCGKLKPLASLENAYKLFTANLWSSIIMGLIIIPISMIASILTFGLIFIIAIIMLPIGALLWFLAQETGIVISLILAAPILLFAIFLISSVFQTLRQSIWLLFFQEIAKIKIAETVEEKVTEEEKELSSAPSPTLSKTEKDA